MAMHCCIPTGGARPVPDTAVRENGNQNVMQHAWRPSASDDFGTVRKLTVNLHMNLLYFRRTVSFLTTVAWKVSPDSEFSQYWLKLQWIK